ncbi:MAG: hypothetical protein P8074_01815 [Anaerolineales bacterium]|jgi:hypothetical protein
MAVKTWQVTKVRYCDHAGEEVALETQMVFPAEWLPYQQPRVLAHRCSHAVGCNLDNRPSCVWAGTNPTFDPFAQPE